MSTFLEREKLRLKILKIYFANLLIKYNSLFKTIILACLHLIVKRLLFIKMVEKVEICLHVINIKDILICFIIILISFFAEIETNLVK